MAGVPQKPVAGVVRSSLILVCISSGNRRSSHRLQVAGTGQALTWQALQPLGAKLGDHNRHYRAAAVEGAPPSWTGPGNDTTSLACSQLSDAVVQAGCMGLEHLGFRGEVGRCSHPVSIRDWIALELMQYSEYEGIIPERLAGANPCGDVQREGLSKSWRGFHWRTGPGGG